MQNNYKIEEFIPDENNFDLERKRVLQLASAQYEDGSFLYSFKLGELDIFPLWFIHCTIAYIKETGDFDILEEMQPFSRKSHVLQPSRQFRSTSYKPVESPLYTHLERAYDLFYRHLSACSPSLPENNIAAGLFSFTTREYVKLNHYINQQYKAALAEKHLKQIAAPLDMIFFEDKWLPHLQTFLDEKTCRCNPAPGCNKCYCGEINQFIYLHMISALSLFCRKAADEYWAKAAETWGSKAVSEWILGIKPGFEGLFVDPCIPDAFISYEVKRYFRNAIYAISILNPAHTPVDVKKLVVDNIEYLGNLLPNFADGKTHTVEVTMGTFC